MKLRWYGHSCFALASADGRTLVTDPFDESVGYPLPRIDADFVTVSHDHFDHNALSSLGRVGHVLSQPGDFRLDGLSGRAVSAFHDAEQGKKRGKNLLFLFEMDGLRVLHLGDLGHPLGPEQIASLGRVDLLLIPVGGFYTIDARQAFDLWRALRPQLCVPMHYKTPRIGFPIADESEFLALTGGRRTDAAQIDPAHCAGVIALPTP